MTRSRSISLVLLLANMALLVAGLYWLSSCLPEHIARFEERGMMLPAITVIVVNLGKSSIGSILLVGMIVALGGKEFVPRPRATLGINLAALLILGILAALALMAVQLPR